MAITLPDTIRCALVEDGQLVRWRSRDDGQVEVMEPPEPTEPTPLDSGVYVAVIDLAPYLLGLTDAIDTSGRKAVGNVGVAVKAAIGAIALALLDLKP